MTEIRKVIDSKNFNSMDMGKFFMAIVVIAIHVHPFEGYQPSIWLDLYKLLCSCAVPFFFLSTGYLLGLRILDIKDIDGKLHVLKKSIFKTIKIYLIWTAIYFPLAVLGYCSSSSSLLGCVLGYIRNLFTVGEHYNSWILWYLVSAIYSLIFVYFLIKKNITIINITLLGAAVFVVAQFITYFVSYSGELNQVALYCQKFIQYTISNGRMFTGFLYIPLGIYLSKFQFHKVAGIITMLTGIGVKILLGDMLIANCIATVVTSIGIFEFICSFILLDNPIYKKLRLSSMVMYFIHLWIWTICYGIMYQTKTYGMEMFIIVTVISLAISYAYIMKNKLR